MLVISLNQVVQHRAIQAIKDHGDTIDENLLQHLSPLGWEHINLTGDYVWRQDRRIQKGKFRPLRPFASPKWGRCAQCDTC